MNAVNENVKHVVYNLEGFIFFLKIRDTERSPVYSIKLERSCYYRTLFLRYILYIIGS